MAALILLSLKYCCLLNIVFLVQLFRFFLDSGCKRWRTDHSSKSTLKISLTISDVYHYCVTRLFFLRVLLINMMWGLVDYFWSMYLCVRRLLLFDIEPYGWLVLSACIDLFLGRPARVSGLNVHLRIFRECCSMYAFLLKREKTSYMNAKVMECSGNQKSPFRLFGILTGKATMSPLPSHSSDQDLAKKFGDF